MFASRSRLRLPATLAALLLVLVGAGEGIGVRLCLHEVSGRDTSVHGPSGGGAAGQEASEPDAASSDVGHGLPDRDVDDRDAGAHGHHGHHAAHEIHDGHDSAHETHRGPDPCGALCQFLCVLAAATHLPGSESGAALTAAPSQGDVGAPLRAFSAAPRHTSLPYFLPFSQAPPVLG